MAAESRFCKRSGDITENQRVVILAGLVGNNSRITTARRNELVFSNIRDPGRTAKEESLHCNDINCIDQGVAIHISSRQPASRKGSPEIKEMPLGGDYIQGVDACRAWQPSGLARRHGIARARGQGRKL